MGGGKTGEQVMTEREARREGGRGGREAPWEPLCHHCEQLLGSISRRVVPDEATAVPVLE